MVASPRALYNENNSDAANRLRDLTSRGLIADGDVAECSIIDLKASDIRGYNQFHAFAGIGGWSLGLRLAGIPDTAQAWTASLPCQQFSIASVNPNTAAKGQADERHLLPDFIRLVEECNPAVIFGEQVPNAIKWGWLDEAFGALENLDYACGAIVAPALSVGARHERKRLYWVANSRGARRQGHQQIERLPFAASQALAKYGNPLAGASRPLDGDFSDLLPCGGISVVLERAALKGYGNAIVPQLAAEVIGAFLDAEAEQAAAPALLNPPLPY